MPSAQHCRFDCNDKNRFSPHHSPIKLWLVQSAGNTCSTQSNIHLNQQLSITYVFPWDVWWMSECLPGDGTAQTTHDWRGLSFRSLRIRSNCCIVTIWTPNTLPCTASVRSPEQRFLFYHISSQNSELVAAFTFLFTAQLTYLDFAAASHDTEAKTIIPIPSGVILCGTKIWLYTILISNGYNCFIPSLIMCLEAKS